MIADLVHRRQFVDKLLSFDELPDTVLTSNNVHSVLKCPIIVGIIANLKDGIESCFSYAGNKSLLLAGGFCIALFMNQDKTWVGGLATGCV
jgi:hypothetical protein